MKKLRRAGAQGKAVKNATEAEALDSVLGYTVANDVSGREWQIDLGGGQVRSSPPHPTPPHPPHTLSFGSA